MAERKTRIHPDAVIARLNRMINVLQCAKTDIKNGYFESAKEMIQDVTDNTKLLTSTLWKGERVKRNVEDNISKH